MSAAPATHGQNQFPAPAQILPHGVDSVFLDRIISAETGAVVCCARVDPVKIGVAGSVVPAWAGLEFMAQAAAVWAGLSACDSDEPVRAGLIAGIRSWRCLKSSLPIGVELEISARAIDSSTDLRRFACTINGLDGELLQTGELSVVLGAAAVQPGGGDE